MGTFMIVLTTSYIQVYPPSTAMFCPLTYELNLDARNNAHVSNSPSLPYLSIGMLIFACPWKKSLSRVAVVRSV